MSFGTAMGGFFGGIWKVIVSIFTLLFFKWKITISMFFLALFLGNALFESVEEKSAMPLIMRSGSILLSADEALYWEIKAIEKNEWRLPSKRIEIGEDEGIWKDFKSTMAKSYFLLEIIGSMWFIFIMGYLLFKFFMALNNQSIVISLFLMVLVMFFFQSGYSLSLLFLNYDCGLVEGTSCFTYEERLEKVSFALNPLKGTQQVVYHLFFTGNLWKHTFLEGAVPDVKISMNQSNQSKALV